MAAASKSGHYQDAEADAAHQANVDASSVREYVVAAFRAVLGSNVRHARGVLAAVVPAPVLFAVPSPPPASTSSTVRAVPTLIPRLVSLLRVE